MPKQVPPAIPTPSLRRSTNTISGCPGKAARKGLLAQSLPLSANTPAARRKIAFQSPCRPIAAA